MVSRCKSAVSGVRVGSMSSASRHLGITETGGAGSLLTLPELAVTRASSVSVGRGRTKALLLLVMAPKTDLQQGSDEEEETVTLLVADHGYHDRGYLRSQDRDGKACGVQAACSSERRRVGDLIALASAAKALLGLRIAGSKRSLDPAGAAVGSITSENGESYKGSAEEDVQDNSDESEESLASEADGEKNGEDGVNDSCSRDSLHRVCPFVDGCTTVGKD